MVLGPVHSHKEHLTSSLVFSEPEEFRSDLMVQCSRHDTPPAVSLLTNRAGHDLVIGISSREQIVVTVRRLETSLTKNGRSTPIRSICAPAIEEAGKQTS
jgi:hypothetical protein